MNKSTMRIGVEILAEPHSGALVLLAMKRLDNNSKKLQTLFCVQQERISRRPNSLAVFWLLLRISPLGLRSERIGADPAILRVAGCWGGGLFVPVAQALDEIGGHRIAFGGRIDAVNTGRI